MYRITSEEIPKLRTELERAMEEAKKKKSRFGGEYGLDLTDWRSERPFLNKDFVSECDGRGFENDRVLGNSMVEELLTLFLGGQTELIVVNDFKDGSNERSVTIDENVDPVDREFGLKCSALAMHYSVLAKFVEDNYFIRCGRVNTALAAGIDAVITDYQGFVVQLETMHRKNSLSLHELWYRIQNMCEIFSALEDLVRSITQNETRGAATLAKLHDFTTRLPESSLVKHICLLLTTEAAAPYMESIQKWVFNGEIYDPYDEFMVVEFSTVRDEWKKVEDYWEKKYQIRKSCVPPFLKTLELQILNSGKYLNLIKECVSSERDLKLAPIKPLVYNENINRINGYPNVINEAYNYASKHLLNYMLREFEIKERIFSLKRYFLLNQGDFMSTLLDTCDSELCQDISDILPSRLTTLVEMALRIPSTNDDKYRDDIVMSLQKLTLSEQLNKILAEGNEVERSFQSSLKMEMTGYESFTLHIDCKWPVSLVLHSKVLSSYQLLFRHLFYIKYIEKILCKVWLLNQSTRDIPFLESRKYVSAHALRYKMMKFIENVGYYMTEVAIETHWVEFMQSFDTAHNIDELVGEHWKFLDRSLKDCLLGDIELFRIFREILSCCLNFGNYTINLRPNDTVPKKFDAFSQKIEQFSAEFEENLSKFFYALQDVSVNDTSSKLVKLFSKLTPFFMGNENV